MSLCTPAANTTCPPTNTARVIAQSSRRMLHAARQTDVAPRHAGVKAGQDQAFWEAHGWIDPQDPRGWFQWSVTNRPTDRACARLILWAHVHPSLTHGTIASPLQVLPVLPGAPQRGRRAPDWPLGGRHGRQGPLEARAAQQDRGGQRAVGRRQHLARHPADAAALVRLSGCARARKHELACASD
jgi:hypothetical protein